MAPPGYGQPTRLPLFCRSLQDLTSRRMKKFVDQGFFSVFDYMRGGWGDGSCCLTAVDVWRRAVRLG